MSKKFSLTIEIDDNGKDIFHLKECKIIKNTYSFFYKDDVFDFEFDSFTYSSTDNIKYSPDYFYIKFHLVKSDTTQRVRMHRQDFEVLNLFIFG